MDELEKRMAKGWPGMETPCGAGSRLEVTRHLLTWFPDVWKRYQVKSFADLGAGDLNWMKKITKPDDLIHSYYDLVPRKCGINKLDITKDPIPKCDMLLCRMVLIHLNLEQTLDALEGIRDSGSKYLVATTWDSTDNAHVDWSADFHRINMDQLLASDPIESVGDGSGREARLAIYKL